MKEKEKKKNNNNKKSVFTFWFCCCLTQTLHPPPVSFNCTPHNPELHVPTHGEAQSIRCPKRKVPKMHLDRRASQRGGAERSIDCREGKWVRPCLTARVALFLAESELLMWQHLQSLCGEDVTCERSKQYSKCLFCYPWDASHSSFSLNLKILCHFSL